jgi:hypothetical protein
MSNQAQIETNVIKPKISIFENESEHRLVDIQSEVTLDQKLNDIQLFISSNNGKGKSDKEKDTLYADAISLWNSYAETLRAVIYTFYLNRKQYQFLTELLRDKLEYDVNTVFLAIELTDMLGEWVEEGTSKNDSDVKGYVADATEMTYIYHLIAKHKVKGLTKGTYLFAQILRRIGEISKIISYYDTAAKNSSKDIQNWVAAFEDGITLSGQPVENIVLPEVKQETIKAKKVGTKKATSGNNEVSA